MTNVDISKRKLTHDQKIIFGEFLSNFSLVWLTYGIVGPLFSPVENYYLFIIRLILSIVSAGVLLKISLDLFI